MTSIGLSDLIQQVKQELLPNPNDDHPFLFVDSIELELKVAISKDAKGKIKIDIFSIGGAEVGGGGSHQRMQTVKLKLSSLFDKAELLELYKNTNSPDVMPAMSKAKDRLMKGSEQGSAEDTVG